MGLTMSLPPPPSDADGFHGTALLPGETRFINTPILDDSITRRLPMLQVELIWSTDRARDLRRVKKRFPDSQDPKGVIF
jgi:hypothetical protein